MQFMGDGPLGGPVAEAATDGFVRGYVKNPDANPPLRPDGKLNVGAAVGKGELKVDRLLNNGEVYQAGTEIVSGEIAEDLTNYLWKSEQIPSALLLGVRVIGQGEVQMAGGVAVQVLPGCPDETVAKLEANLTGRSSITDLLLEKGLEGTVEVLMKGLDYQAMDLKAVGFKDGYIPLAFRCRCSRERAKNALIYFSPEERLEMIKEDNGAEVLCHWCGREYRFTPHELDAIEAQASENPQA